MRPLRVALVAALLASSALHPAVADQANFVVDLPTDTASLGPQRRDPERPPASIRPDRQSNASMDCDKIYRQPS